MTPEQILELTRSVADFIFENQQNGTWNREQYDVALEMLQPAINAEPETAVVIQREWNTKWN